MAPGAPGPASGPCSHLLAEDQYLGLSRLLRALALIADSDGMYKLWRDGAGGWYTVETECGPRGFECSLKFTCRANESWDDLSDEC